MLEGPIRLLVKNLNGPCSRRSNVAQLIHPAGCATSKK